LMKNQNHTHQENVQARVARLRTLVLERRRSRSAQTLRDTVVEEELQALPGSGVLLR
jgi:hypothetical protein